MVDEMMEYGRADAVQVGLGLTPIVGQKIAAIITFTAAIEHYLERALWTLQGINPAGTQPGTDNKKITDLIGMLEAMTSKMGQCDSRTMIEKWCEAARSGFIIRNNIAHGAPSSIEGTLVYMRNPRWHGEIRKREFGDFWADDNTLDLVRRALAVLIRIVLQLAKGEKSPAEIATPLAMKALRKSRSVLGEFADQGYDPSYEKY